MRMPIDKLRKYTSSMLKYYGVPYSHTFLEKNEKHRYVKDPSTDTPFIFDIGQHTLEFGRREFCLVIGFHFGKVCLDHLSKGPSGFRDRVFPGVARVKGIELNKLLHSQTDFNNLLDDDVVRVCLLLALDFVFMGFELRHVISNQLLNLVNDFSAWDNFPRGQYIWEEFHKRVYNNDHTFQQNVIPRSVEWSDGTPFLKCDYDRLFNVRTRLSTITPFSDEMNKPWWKSSLEYFHNVSNASTTSHAPSNKKKSQFKRKVVSREVHVHTEVSREVHVRTDVHHYVDEGLSVQDLVKKIGDMQREFQSRITAVEQYVNQHKTSSTANDSHSFSRFTENPDDRAALINKIMDMRPSCGYDNHVKTSVESDVDNQNVDNHSMDFHHDPKTSFESDVNNHSMDFDHDPKVLEQQNISGKNLFDEFEQHVSSNNLFNHEFSTKKLDAQLEMEELFEVDTLCLMIDFDIPKEQMHNQLPTEPMIPEATIQGCNNLETTQSILTEYESQHAIHDQFDTLSMKNADSVQGSNDAKVDVNPTVAVNSLRVPLERDHKVSRYLQDPYVIQSDSTKPNHKVRARHKKNKKRCMPLTTPDGKLIPAWTEDLFCPSNSPKTRVNVPKEIINFLREIEEHHFYFPWSMDGTFVYNNFWQGLLGIGKERRGWLT
ncbi:phospholipase-like protein [Tanacetum coccineum]